MSKFTNTDVEDAIKLVAFGMTYHNAPEALPLLKRIEAELERRRTEGDALSYADRVLAKYTKTIANDNPPPKRLAG